MKEYIKPEVEIVRISTEYVLADSSADLPPYSPSYESTNID